MNNVPELLRFDKIHQDPRGSFFNLKAKQALSMRQVSLSNNPTKYTFRGMHWQMRECPDHKFVCVTEGAIVDVLIDVDNDSLTFGKKFFFIIKPSDGVLSIPPSYAHGFLTLKECTTVLYLHAGRFSQSNQRKASPFACGLPKSILSRIAIISNEDRLGLPLNEAKY